MNFELADYFKEKKQLIDSYLKECIPSENTDPEALFKSMHYSLLAPGKRIRPVLVLASANCLGMNEKEVLPIACALEMIHVFSLIHDDLPAMDDDDLRRNQPTNHKVFGEANAILAGDALLSHAFSVLTKLDSAKYEASSRITLINEFSQLTGVAGMISGQIIDLESENTSISLERLKTLHRHKTGALIRLSVTAPAILNGESKDIISNLNSYGDAIGLAFQIADDILDIEGGENIGKDVGSDVENNKATYPSLLGLEGAKTEAANTLEQALTALSPFGEKADTLKKIAHFIVERKS